MASSVITEPVERSFGPASRRTRLLERVLRRGVLPVARAWRLTPRGLRWLQRATDPGSRARALDGTVIEHARVGGRPAEWVRGPGALARNPRDAEEPMVLYLHGGGYVFGSPRTHRDLVSRISHATGCAALALDYRLPPEAILPAPIEDALAAYRELLDAGRDPARIVVAGDSAGGNLALTLALHAVEADLPQPAALVLLSPWADLTMSGASFTRNAAREPFLPPTALRRFARVALGGATDPADWRVSPLFAPAELLRELPPTLVQVGSTEVLRDDGARVARRLAAAGVPTELQVFDRQPHVVPFWTGTPEARTALREIGRLVRTALAGEVAGVPRNAAPDASASS